MKKTIHDDYQVVTAPAISHLKASVRTNHDAMLQITQEIKSLIERHVDGIAGASVRFTTREECSHCGLRWETLTADQAADPAWNVDEHSVADEPVCCSAAVAEFRAERGIPAETAARLDRADEAALDAAAEVRDAEDGAAR